MLESTVFFRSHLCTKLPYLYTLGLIDVIREVSSLLSNSHHIPPWLGARTSATFPYITTVARRVFLDVSVDLWTCIAGDTIVCIQLHAIGNANAKRSGGHCETSVFPFPKLMSSNGSGSPYLCQASLILHAIKVPVPFRVVRIYFTSAHILACVRACMRACILQSPRSLNHMRALRASGNVPQLRCNTLFLIWTATRRRTTALEQQ